MYLIIKFSRNRVYNASGLGLTCLIECDLKVFRDNTCTNVFLESRKLKHGWVLKVNFEIGLWLFIIRFLQKS